MKVTVLKLIILMATMLERGWGERVPCVDNCEFPKRPLCAIDSHLGARFFDNYCLMDAFNLCYKTGYEAQSDPGECMRMYDEEYSRESKIPFKNPRVRQLYGDTVDHLYL